VFQWLQAVFFFFAAFAFAPLARCAAAILFLAAAVMVRLAGAGLVFIPTDIDGTRPGTFAHLAFCARLIRLRADADIERRGAFR
jgi:hypothetical protein